MCVCFVVCCVRWGWGGGRSRGPRTAIGLRGVDAKDCLFDCKTLLYVSFCKRKNASSQFRIDNAVLRRAMLR